MLGRMGVIGVRAYISESGDWGLIINMDDYLGIASRKQQIAQKIFSEWSFFLIFFSVPRGKQSFGNRGTI